jgi:small subunit ribosomal protein S8
MSQTDPIADYLTCIRNGVKAKKEFVEAPHSKIKVRIAEILRDEGFVRGFEVIDAGRGNKSVSHKMLRVYLRYLDADRRSPVIEGIKRVSKPGRRIYVPASGIPTVRSGIGVSILSTSRGIVTDRVARGNRWGGEIICNVW